MHPSMGKHFSMAKQQGPQGRSLAITLTSLTFVTYIVLILFALHASIFYSNGFWRVSLFLAYNSFAAGTSIMGLAGAVRMNPSLVSAYVLAQTTALLLGTLALLSIVVPSDFWLFDSIVPSLEFDVARICNELDDSFGRDEGWLERCQGSFSVVKLLIAWLGLLLLAVQWVALGGVWRWSREMGRELRYSKREGWIDVEKALVVEKRRG